MNVSLTPELEHFVQQKVESGRYLSASDVVCEALHLLEGRDRLRELKLDELRKFVTVGIEQADRGEIAPLDIDATLARVRSRKGKLDDGELMARVQRTEQAERDLEEILDYLDDHSPAGL